MSYRMYRFGTTQLLPGLDISQDIGSSAARIGASDTPRGGASDLLGDGRATRGGYEVKCSGKLQGSSAADLQTQFDALRSYHGKRDRLWRMDDSGSMTWAWARLKQMDATRSAKRYRFVQEVDLTFFVFSPLWYSFPQGQWYLDDGYKFDDGLYLDDIIRYPLTSTATVITIHNSGTGDATTLKLLITAGAVSLSSIRIQTNNGTDLTWTGTLAAGKQLAIDFDEMTIHNDGVDAYAGLALGSGHTLDDWLRLAPGDTTMTLTRTGGSDSSAEISYYEGWI